ncbi:MAG TPA: hypothetical protein VK864_00320, partial [Longimicrobiales bacterium]|nr:hypothetical protein [Longimicrobiales bacterium]
LPPTFVFNLIGRRAIGRALTDEYAAWESDLRFRYLKLSDSLRASGLTETTRLTLSGRSALYPRISADSRTLSFAEEDGRNAVRTRVIDIENGRTVRRARRNSLGPADWLPDGNLITAQLDFTNRYSIHSDLYQFAGGDQRRLTRRARLEEPDVNAAGDRIIAVENGEGASRLVMLDRNGTLLRAVTPLSFGTGWSLPRWSPDGTRIAAGRWSAGGAYDILVVDTSGAELLRATEDEAVDAAPAWSPDGRYIVFWSDRTGIPNLFAFDTTNRALFQVTNLLTGAFHPDVSPDGRYIVFAAYHAVGYYIERIRFDPSSWKPAAANVIVASHDRPRATLDGEADRHVQPTLSEPRGYRPWRTLLPRFWFPFVQREDAAGEFYGLATSGVDLVGRHAYGLTIGYNIEDGRTIGFGSYVYAGLANPTVQLALERDWDDLGRARVAINNGADTVTVERIEREDVGELSLTFQRRRFRTSTSLSLGGEIVYRHRVVPGSTGVRFVDARDRLYGPIARIVFANYRFPALAISREDGLFLQVGGRWRFEPDTVQRDRGYRELTTWNTFYKSLPLPGFAHHVLAARFSAALRDGSGASLLEVGGTPGGAYDFGLATIGLGGSFLPVRGFQEGDQAGTRAWSASAEYRMPLFQLGRGYKLWPVFLDRMHLTAFGDAGRATCDAVARSTFLSCQDQSTDLMTSVGGEVGADISMVSFFTTRMRIGVAQPLTGPRQNPLVYVTFGPSF